MDEGTTFVYDATDMVVGRLASQVAKQLLSGAKDGREDRVVIINAEKAIVSGKRDSVINTYLTKYRLNHARKGPFYPRMPDMILKRTIRGMLPYQRKSSGRRALKGLRIEIGCPFHLRKDLPEGHEKGDDSKIRRELPQRYIRLGEISAALGISSHRWTGGES